jgi:hypothetical protein
MPRNEAAGDGAALRLEADAALVLFDRLSRWCEAQAERAPGPPVSRAQGRLPLSPG